MLVQRRRVGSVAAVDNDSGRVTGELGEEGEVGVAEETEIETDGSRALAWALDGEGGDGEVETCSAVGDGGVGTALSEGVHCADGGVGKEEGGLGGGDDEVGEETVEVGLVRAWDGVVGVWWTVEENWAVL